MQFGCAERDTAGLTDSPLVSNAGRIKLAVPRDETIHRYPGSGDNFHMSWAADDRQFVGLSDGMGWLENPKGMYNSKLFLIQGGPQQAKFEDVPGYPEIMMGPEYENMMRYYGFGLLAIDGYIYQYLSTPNRQFFLRDGGNAPSARFVGAKLIYSPDNGLTWHNQGGSTPVVWEPWEHRSRKNMVFFEEPQDAFSLLSILQMGKNYEANKDGYVYVYSPNGNTEGTMNQLVLFRVPETQILNRGAYEYFAERRADGAATWTKDINARGIVHTFPSGWVNKTMHPYAWQPSVVYNAPLRVFLMANWGMGSTPNGHMFGKASYLGLWVADRPWGPWTQVHEDDAWTPGNDLQARAYQPQISPKWISEDGKSFWLVWTDHQERKEACDNRDAAQGSWFDVCLPYYVFNTQRVDLIVE